MTIAGEMVKGGFVIYVAAIVAWDDSNGELIDKSERDRVLQNVKGCLELKGEKVTLE